VLLLFNNFQIKDNEVTPKQELLDVNNRFNYILGKLTYLKKETENLYLRNWHFEKVDPSFSALLTLWSKWL